MSETTPDLAALLATSKQRGPAHSQQWTKAEREARRKEQASRSSRAQSYAKTALAKLHPDDFRALYEQAFDMVNAECGPLPGDPS